MRLQSAALTDCGRVTNSSWFTPGFPAFPGLSAESATRQEPSLSLANRDDWSPLHRVSWVMHASWTVEGVVAFRMDLCVAGTEHRAWHMVGKSQLCHLLAMESHCTPGFPQVGVGQYLPHSDACANISKSALN